MLKARRGSAVLSIGFTIAGIILILDGVDVYMTRDAGLGAFVDMIGVLCFLMAVISARGDL
jgi:hypothetical protein